MAGAEFKILFAGELVEGADPAQVRANLANLFKTEVAKVESLFSGERKVIRRDVDEATARKFQAGFARAGAVAVIVDADGVEHLPEASQPPAPSTTEAPPVDTRPASPPPAPPVPAQDSDDLEPSRTTLAEAGRAPPPLLARGQPSAPDDMTMADAGAILIDEPTVTESPNIDTSHLTLSEPGVDLTEHENVSAPQFDLSTYELAPPGSAMSEEP